MNKKPDKGFTNYVRYSGLAFQMAATILICVFLGLYIDDKRGGHDKLFTALLSVFGVLASLYNLIRSVRKP